LEQDGIFVQEDDAASSGPYTTKKDDIRRRFNKWLEKEKNKSSKK
jgi:hypothetical protein